MEAFLSSLLGALVGASASLVGVVLAQRGERRRAHADRIWTARTEEYSRILRYVRDIRTWAVEASAPVPEGRRFSAWPPSMREAEPSMEQSVVEADHRIYVASVLVFASGQVTEAMDSLDSWLSSVARGFAPQSWEPPSQLPPMVVTPTILEVIHDKCNAVDRLIRLELRGEVESDSTTGRVRARTR